MKRLILILLSIVLLATLTLVLIKYKKEEYYVLFDVPGWKNPGIVTDKQKREFEKYLKDELNVKVSEFSTYSPGVYVQLTKSEYRYLVKHYDKVDYIYPTNVEPGLP